MILALRVAALLTTFSVLPAAAQAPAPSPAMLPDGVTLTVRLETILDAKQSKVGDEIIFSVSKDAKHKGAVVVPKKAVIRGHIRYFNIGKGQGTVGLEPEQIEFGDTKLRFRAQLTDILTDLPGTTRHTYPGVTRAAGSVGDGGSADSAIVSASSSVLPNNTPGIGTFVVNESGFKLRNLEMQWRTLAAEAPKQ